MSRQPSHRSDIGFKSYLKQLLDAVATDAVLLCGWFDLFFGWPNPWIFKLSVWWKWVCFFLCHCFYTIPISSFEPWSLIAKGCNKGKPCILKSSALQTCIFSYTLWYNHHTKLRPALFYNKPCLAAVLLWCLLTFRCPECLANGC